VKRKLLSSDHQEFTLPSKKLKETDLERLEKQVIMDFLFNSQYWAEPHVGEFNFLQEDYDNTDILKREYFSMYNEYKTKISKTIPSSKHAADYLIKDGYESLFKAYLCFGNSSLLIHFITANLVSTLFHCGAMCPTP
jgi:hypothetical protein